MPVDHWMTFGSFAEQRYFAYPAPGAYKGVIINANMAAYAPDGMAAFLMERTGSLSYLIDPQTHAFQHEPSAVQNKDGEIKKSIRELAQHYGEPVASAAGVRPVLPEHFSPDMRSAFVDRVLGFQQTVLPTTMEGSEANEYLGHSVNDLQPYALLAPYFFLTETAIDEWLDVNRSLAVAAVAQKPPGARIFVPLVLSKGVLLSDSARPQLEDTFDGVPADGFVVWIDDLNEHEASEAVLYNLLTLAQALCSSGREVINLHGGYFSILAAGVLGSGAFSGVAHGPEFGEFRSVVPVGGGIPIAKYYMPPLHSRVRYRDALDMLRRKGWLSSAGIFHQSVCDCDTCIKVMAGNPEHFVRFGEAAARQVRRGNGFVRMEFPTSEAKERCLCHYLHRKQIEYQFARTASEQQLLDNLERGVQDLRSIVGTAGVSHLQAWRTVLTTP